MTIDLLKANYNCDKVIVFFWNASHDKRVVQHYVTIPEHVSFIDALGHARKITKNRYKSYKLGYF